jgi:hypothetical protein
MRRDPDSHLTRQSVIRLRVFLSCRLLCCGRGPFRQLQIHCSAQILQWDHIY